MSAKKKAVQKAKTAFENKRRERLNAARYVADGSPRDVLTAVPPALLTYSRNGLDATLHFETPASWTAETEAEVFALTKANMKELYDATKYLGWTWADGKKRKELKHPESRYIIARDRTDGRMLGFLDFRFEQEETHDSLYVYELQLKPETHRKGLGKFLMMLALMGAPRMGMQYITLTVLKNNTAAVAFYRSLKFEIDPDSPSNHDEPDVPYEIMSRCVDAHAAAAMHAWYDEIAAGRVPARDPYEVMAAAAAATAATPPTAAAAAAVAVAASAPVVTHTAAPSGDAPAERVAAVAATGGAGTAAAVP